MRLWTIALTDLKIAAKDKMFFFWLLLFAFLFGQAFQTSSFPDTRISINILDQDRGILSEALIEEWKSEKYALNLLDKKKETGTRTLIIPSGFSEKILRGEKVELVLEKEAGRNMEAGQAAYARILQGVVKVMTRLIQLAPENMQELENRFPETSIKELISLKVEQAGKLKTIPSGFNHSVPGITVMFLLFTVLMYGGINLLEKRRQGQLERIILTPASFTTLIGEQMGEPSFDRDASDYFDVSGGTASFRILFRRIPSGPVSGCEVFQTPLILDVKVTRIFFVSK